MHSRFEECEIPKSPLQARGDMIGRAIAVVTAAVVTTGLVLCAPAKKPAPPTAAPSTAAPAAAPAQCPR